MASRLIFTPIPVKTREDYDTYMDELDELRMQLRKELNRVDKIRRDLDLKKVRFGSRSE
jgi:hypothetical protein